MAQDKEFYIKIGGIKESISNLSTLEEALSSIEKKVNTVNSNGGFTVTSKESSKAMDELGKLTQKITQYDKEYQMAVEASKGVLKDKNQEVKQAIELEKANLVVQEGSKSTYAEKQQLLSALGKVIKNTNAETDEEIQKQNELKAQYAALNQELKDFDASLGNHQRNVGDYGQATKNLKQELREFQLEMANMLDNGVSKADPQFVELAKKAGALKDAMSDAGEEINRFASDTKKLDDVINIAQSATAAFELYNGAMSAFGIETEGAEEAMQKLMGAMSIIQSLQTLSETLQNGSATARLFNTAMKATGVQLVQNQLASIKATAAQKDMSLAQKAGAITSKTLGLAMKTIPLMLIIGLVTELVLHWKDIVGWFKKTFPVLNKMGGMMNTLKGVFVGFGKAIIHWVTNPLKTFANVIKKVLKGDFNGAVQEAINGLKNQFKGSVDAFNNGYKKQIDKGLDEIAKKNAAKQAEQTRYELDQLKARKGNQAKYSREGIALQKKEFEQRKKAAKGNAEELKKINLDELNFQRECEEQKAASAKKAADEIARANKIAANKRAAAAKKTAAAAKKAADDEARRKQEELELKLKADRKFYKSEGEYLIAQKNIEIENAKAQVDLYKTGPVEKYKEAIANLNEKLKELDTLQRQALLYDYFDDYRSNVDASVDSLDEFMKGMNAILKKSQEYGKNVSQELFAEFAKENKIFENLTEDEYKYLYGIFLQYLKDGLKNKKKLEEETNKQIAEQTISINKKTIDNITAKINHLTSDNSPETVSVFSRIFNPKKAKEAYQNYKDYWQKVLDETNKDIPILEATWDAYLESVKAVYKEDSKEYIEATEKKKKALNGLTELQKKAAKGATGGTVSNDEKKHFKNPSPINKDESKTKFDDKNGGFGLDPTNWDALWDNDGPVWENLGKLADLMFENVLDPIAEGFSALLDFEIEEAQEALDKATEMHDKSVDKLEESQNKVQELNDKMKNSSGAQLEALKQQQADEMLLLAQREAEEKRLAREKEKREKELAKKEKQQRKLELKMQLIEGIVNTAVSVTKALTWGWPLGAIFAGIIGAMGAMQTAIIRKQMSKLADGGVLGGKSHAQGGVKIPSLGVEVEKGEAVINKRSTAKYLPLLDAINAEGNGGKHTLMKTRHNVYGISKFANGGVLNYQRIDDNFKQLDGTKTVERAIQNIDIHPQVSVVDINRGQKNLTQVRQMAGASR